MVGRRWEGREKAGDVNNGMDGKVRRVKSVVGEIMCEWGRRGDY